MPQLDITLNIIWYICSIIGLGVLYLHDIYIYIPFFIRYWKFQSVYKLHMLLFTLKLHEVFFIFLSSGQYFISSCTNITYGGSSEHLGIIWSLYDLDVLDCSGPTSINDCEVGEFI